MEFDSYWYMSGDTEAPTASSKVLDASKLTRAIFRTVQSMTLLMCEDGSYYCLLIKT
jgi:hypothetical protein